MTLSMQANEVSALPRGFRKLTALRNLDATNNNLAEIPSVVTQLVGLRILKLSGSLCRAVPAAIGVWDLGFRVWGLGFFMV
jgi:Leucine-rich repeat (LRR) protein